jgi:hypothetical protein
MSSSKPTNSTATPLGWSEIVKRHPELATQENPGWDDAQRALAHEILNGQEGQERESPQAGEAEAPSTPVIDWQDYTFRAIWFILNGLANVRAPSAPSRETLWRWGRRALIGATLATATCAAAMPPALEFLRERGEDVANEAIRYGKNKRGMELTTADGKKIGYLYGKQVGGEPGIAGDRSIETRLEDFKKGGPLYWYKRALIEVEDDSFDKEHSTFGLSDRTGFNGRLPLTILLGQGGGSSLYDTTCGDARAGFDGKVYREGFKFWFDWMRGIPGLSSLYRELKDGRLENYSPRLVDKLEESACAAWLADNMTPDEVLQIESTLAYLGPGAEGVELFARIYFGFEDGIRDSRMTRGHQFVLAALVNHPWNSTDEQWEEEIRVRARAAVTRLWKEGEMTKKERNKIYKEIDAARPMPSSEVDRSMSPAAYYRPVILAAIREMYARFGANWRIDKKGLRLTIIDDLQWAVSQAGEEAKAEVDKKGRRVLSDEAHPVIKVVNERGEILAMFTDDEVVARFSKEGNRGSIGKTLDIAGIAEQGYWASDRFQRPREMTLSSPAEDLMFDELGVVIEVPETEDPATHHATMVDPLWNVYEHLSASNAALIDDAKLLGVSQDFVRELMECYGTPGSSHDYIRSAALGNWNVSVDGTLGLMNDVLSTQPLGPLHVVASVTETDGDVISMVPELSSSREAIAWKCYEDMHQGGATASWMVAPLEPPKGTARRLVEGLTFNEGDIVGKTGTACSTDEELRGQVCDPDGGNNGSFVVAARRMPNGEVITVFSGVMADRPTDDIGPKGTHSIRIAIPIGAQIMEELDRF